MSARTQVGFRPLTAELIRQTMRRVYPKRNDYVADMALFEELLPELARFGITTRGALQRLATKHRRALLTDDRSRLSAREQAWYVESRGAEFIYDAVRRQYWFAYPALVRNALQSEFGEVARVWEVPRDDVSEKSE